MKILVLLGCFVVSAMSQRPSFAGSSPKGVPDLHPRFKPNDSDVIQTTGSNVANRFGENGGTTQRLPVDARGDVNLVNRLNDWPKENRPFWLTNYEIIEQQRGRPVAHDTNNQNTGTQQTSTNQLLSNRFGEGSNQPDANNSFSVVMNGQWRTYVYNSPSDSWIRKQ